MARTIDGRTVDTTPDPMIGTTPGPHHRSIESYRSIPRRLAALEAFRGHSMSAHHSDDAYIVLSYATCIATWRPGRGWQVIGENRWGPTTGRHINLCRRTAGLID